MMSDNVNNNARPLNAPNVAHNFIAGLCYIGLGSLSALMEYVSAFQGF